MARTTNNTPRIALTVDVCALAIDESSARLCVVKRKNAPHKGAWALPGGFAEAKEEIAESARRELQEETGLVASELEPIGHFGAPGRDPRGRTVSLVYAALFLGEEPELTPADDAADAKWVDVHRPGKLAFDHKDIVKQTLAHLREMIELRGHLGPLLPRKFSMGDLRMIHDTLTGEDLDADAFAARMRRNHTIVHAGKLDGRSALYRYKKVRTAR
ncbi:MAG: NUDIX hydrolase [Planctomycetota bacterium]